MFRLLRKIKFIFIFVCFILFVGGVAVFGNSHFNKKVKEVPSSTEVNNSTNENNTNILLLGEDTNSMMIASVDEEKKNISITPVENVSYVDNSTKETLLNSIEKKTKVNLDKFIQVSISDMMKVVSTVGGITDDVKKEDLKLINNMIPKFYAESTDDNKGKMMLLSSPGVQKINGYQAMAYAAVIGNDKNKQKEVILSLIENIKGADFTKYIEIFNTIKPHVETNLTVPDMIKLSSSQYTFN